MACCFLGERDDLAIIDAYLLQPNASLRGGEKAFEVSRSSLRKHRDVCLRGGATVATPSAAYRNTTPTFAGQSSAPPANATPPHGRTMAANEGPPTVHLGSAALAATEEEQTAYVSALIEGNRFHFTHTLTWLERVWKLPPADVRRRYEVAVSRCSADRQVAHAEKEVSLAALENQERLAMAEFRRLRRTEIAQARGYLNTAVKCRSEYAAIAGLKTAKVEVSGSINIWHRPEFVMEVERFTEATLDVLAPPDERAAEAMLDRARIAAERVLGQAVDPAIVAALGTALLEQLQAEATARFGALAAEGSGQGPAFQVEEAPEPSVEQQAAE